MTDNTTSVQIQLAAFQARTEEQHKQVTETLARITATLDNNQTQQATYAKEQAAAFQTLTARVTSTETKLDWLQKGVMALAGAVLPTGLAWLKGVLGV